MFLCQKCRSLRVILSHTQVPQGNRYLLNHQLLLNAATRKQAFSSLSVIKPSQSWTSRKINSSLLSNRPVSRSSRLLQRKLYVSSEDYATDFPEPRFLEHEEDYSPHLHHEELEVEPEVLFEDLPATLPEKQNAKKKNEKTQTSGKKKRKSAEGPSDTRKTQNALTKPSTAIHSIKGKDIALERSFKSFFEICIHQGMFDRAFLSLKHNHEKGNLPSSTSVYDTLLRGAARLARWRVYQEVRGLMKERDIKPSLGSFAAGFECLGRSTLENVSTYAANLLEEMQNSNFKPGDVYEHCRFAADEMEFVTKGLRFAVPDFVPQRSPPLLAYSCHLTKDLNNLECGSSVISPAEGVLTNSQLADLAKQQLETELNGFLEVKSVANQVNEDPNVRARSVEKLETLEESWREVVTDSFEKNVRIAKAQFYSSSLARKPIQLYPYLVSLPKEEFVQLVMQDIRTLASGSETFSPSLHLLCRQLGARVMQRFHLVSKQDSGMLNKIRKVYSDYCTWYMSGQEGRILNPRQKWQELLSQNLQGPDLDAEEIQWPYSVQSSIGHLLYNIILKDLKIAPDEDGTTSAVHVPAFYVVYRNKGVKLVREVKPHPSVSETYTRAAGRKLSFDSLLVPMLSPPLPWTSHRTGGYLLSPVPLIRLPTYAHQQRVRVASAPQQQLYPALDCLNALGSVPWKINTRILDLVVHVFNNKGDKKLEVPQPPSECPVPPAMEQGMSSADRAMVYKERQAARRRKAEMYSIWCDTLYRLSLANHFRDKVFWLPHNMDFRGRVYPCPPHLTHLSSDMARSLLVFALGKPLGPKGLDWLKIHVINLTGLKKRDAVSERLKYADEIMPEILDSADQPLTGNRWWVNSDEPWQTLATCMEIAGALRSPNPEEYVCHLPIHQDGSCNGLQHYAALGRDTVGGESVNLAPAERPQDVYSSVAALVERERAKDAAAGLEIAKVLEGHIKRKVIKQTVMTTVYGVTQFGARLQIAKQLEDLADFPRDHVWAGAMYLAGKTFQSLGEMFTSAKVIQDWFTDCARLVSSVCCQNVEWVTPLGLPVVQPYTKAQIKRADKEESYYCDSLEKPNALKQRNAFPPNFIHSLDSSHMMLTSLFSQRAGITFASIHDCFWTHACTVDSMNKICRQQFVALHSEPILENLSRSFINLYAFKTKDFTNDGSVQDMTKYRLNRVLTQVPRRGDFDLNQVLNSVYFFS